MKKRTLTLLEVMIVILLISLITGVIGYNMKGSLDKGKKFKSIQAKEQLHDMLLMCVAEGKDPEKVQKEPEQALKALGLAKDLKKLMKDGWGAPFSITLTSDKKDFEITSKNKHFYEEKEGE
ncbi:MAG: general secretion pathway protein GspG [Verrucomicrobiota bacterium]|nr:general secretion pathway protein GspG [Verrucomicrobiota bacterium]